MTETTINGFNMFGVKGMLMFRGSKCFFLTLNYDTTKDYSSGQLALQQQSDGTVWISTIGPINLSEHCRLSQVPTHVHPELVLELK